LGFAKIYFLVWFVWAWLFLSKSIDFMSLEKTPSGRLILKGISPSVYEHPADRAALEALRKVPGIDTIVKFFSSQISERQIGLFAMASFVKVGENQFKSVYDLHLEACQILDMDYIPDLYVAQTPELNAMAWGVNRPILVLNSATLSALDKDELLCVIGHELAHIKSGHTLYRQILFILLRFSLPILATLPIAGLALQGIMLALMEWSRKSELSADRAGLLTVQDYDVAVRLEMKLAGGQQIDQMSIAEFVKQAEAYKEADGLADTFFKLAMTAYATHPFAVVRVNELIKWMQSGEYDTILRGDFEKQNQSYSEHLKEAAKSYQEDLKEKLGGIADDIKGAAERAKKFMDDLRSGKNKDQ
jgi:Zn-dependent protease with chaperone function